MIQQKLESWVKLYHSSINVDIDKLDYHYTLYIIQTTTQFIRHVITMKIKYKSKINLHICFSVHFSLYFSFLWCWSVAVRLELCNYEIVYY